MVTATRARPGQYRQSAWGTRKSGKLDVMLLHSILTLLFYRGLAAVFPSRYERRSSHQRRMGLGQAVVVFYVTVDIAPLATVTFRR